MVSSYSVWHFFFDPEHGHMFYISSERARRGESNGVSNASIRCPGAIWEHFLWYILCPALGQFFAHQHVFFYISVDAEFFAEYLILGLIQL